MITLIGTMFVVLSLSEIASMYPTAGGMTLIPRPPANPCVSLTFSLAMNRSIPLGLLSYTCILPKNGILVYWLDLNWRTIGVLCLGGLCSRLAAPGSHHLEPSGLLHPDKMARDAFLLAYSGLLNCHQYLGL
jgi:hypothetical protein